MLRDIRSSLASWPFPGTGTAVAAQRLTVAQAKKFEIAYIPETVHEPHHTESFVQDDNPPYILSGIGRGSIYVINQFFFF